MIYKNERLSEPIQIRQGILTFRLEENPQLTGQRFRAAITRLCPEYPQLSQRTPSGKLIYRHPHVQYKVMDEKEIITALGDESELLIEVFATLTDIILGGRRFKILEKNIDIQEVWFGPVNKELSYVFVSPWLALNQNNEKIYRDADNGGKREILNSVLTGNILSMAKGLGFFIVPNVVAILGNRWSETPSYLKGIQMQGIRSRFKTTFQIPHLWGIGKSSSSGWSTTVPIM